mmetsp:Transcript_15351/g.46068  ORF Transcript_15351/g.46068 Transcript_15351/m.46068 type:complete len:202 (+) Transcript_15351:1156-1761(+)
MRVRAKMAGSATWIAPAECVAPGVGLAECVAGAQGRAVLPWADDTAPPGSYRLDAARPPNAALRARSRRRRLADVLHLHQLQAGRPVQDLPLGRGHARAAACRNGARLRADGSADPGFHSGRGRRSVCASEWGGCRWLQRADDRVRRLRVRRVHRGQGPVAPAHARSRFHPNLSFSREDSVAGGRLCLWLGPVVVCMNTSP